MIVSFEGIDGCGKSSLINSVALAIDDIPLSKIHIFRFPTHTHRFGIKAREMLKLPASDFNYSEFFSLCLYDMNDVQSSLSQLSNDNNLVLLDRYLHSSLAYEILLDRHDQPFITKEEIADRIYREFNLSNPDIIFLVDINPLTAKDRRNQRGRGDPIEDADRFIDLRNEYMSLVGNPLYGNIQILNGHKSIDSLTKMAVDIIKSNNKYIV